MTVLRSITPPEVAAQVRTVRTLQVTMGVLTAAGLIAFGAHPGAPLPLLVSLIGWELSPFKRRLAGLTVELEDRLVVRDAGAAPPPPVVPSEVSEVGAWLRVGDAFDELHLALWQGDRATCLTARLPPRSLRTAPPWVADLDTAEERLGALPGWRDTLLPAEATLRRAVSDPRGDMLRWLAARTPAHRLAVRAWQGQAIPDHAGRRAAPPAGRLRVDGDRWWFMDRSGALRVVGAGRARRPQPVRVQGPGREELIDLDLLVVELDGGLVVDLPAPAAAGLPTRQLPPDALHLHAAEAAGLVDRLLEVDPDRHLAPALTPAVL